MKAYKVILWDFNRDNIEYYDIMPYLVDTFKEEVKRKYKVFCDGKKPESFEDYKSFVLSASKYQFRARCEYEVILTGWPVQKRHLKIDAYQQIESNADIVTQVFLDNIK